MDYDVLVIGGGVTGCSIARSLSRYDLRIALLEKDEDVCSGTSKANSAIVHAGYDPVPGTLKAKLNIEGSRMMPQLAKDLDIDFKQNGSLIVCFDEADKPKLQELYDRGIANGVPDMKILFVPTDVRKAYVKEDEARRLVNAVLACPDGVERMSQTMPGTVETSNNLAIVKIADGKVSVVTLMRSFIDSAKVALSRKIAAVLNNAGVATRFTGAYSGWAPDDKSQILKVMKDSYRKLYGKEPEVMAIHAGLECGIIGGIYPGLDMISFGPTLKSPHSPDERCFIPSVQKAWDFLVAVLEAVPER